MSTTTAILCAFGVYLLLMIGIGVWCMKKTTGADDYFLGGRGLSGPVAALSAQARAIPTGISPLPTVRDVS